MMGRSGSRMGSGGCLASHASSGGELWPNRIGCSDSLMWILPCPLQSAECAMVACQQQHVPRVKHEALIHIPVMTRIDLFTAGAEGGLVRIRVGKPIGLERRRRQTLRARDNIRDNAS